MRLDTVIDPAAAAGVAAGIERAGYACAWVTETVRDPFLVLALAAVETHHVRLGTGVAIAFARSPMTLAQSAHDLQRISGGRLLLGLGSQVRPHITRRFGMPWSRPADRMREYVHALRAIWASWNDGAEFEFRGEFYSHTLMTPVFDPGPNGFGPPTVLLGGVGARMAEVAGEVADGFPFGPLTSVESLRALSLPALERGRARSGARDITVAGMPFVVTGTLADMADLVDDEVLDAFAVVAEPDDVGSALRARWDGLADSLTVHCADDPGPVWPVIAGATARTSIFPAVEGC